MRRAVSAIVLAFLAAYVVFLGARPLHSPDETRYAEIAREMLATGDWVVPRLDGVRYFEKPPLYDWITAASLRVLGQNDFAARLPSALAVGLTAWILFLLARRWSANRSVAPIAVVVYLTSLLTFVVGVTNTIDSVFTLILTALFACLFQALQASRAASRRTWLVLAGVSCGLAFLTKGFLAFVLPGIVVAPFLVLERRWRETLRLAWIPSVVALVVALPWSVAIHLREPDYWRYFVVVEHLHRFRAVEGHAQHAQPVWYFLGILLASQIFWLPLLPAGVAGYTRERWRDPFVRWALLWAALPFAFFSVASGKLATYVLPCLPPLAILVAVGLAEFVERGRSKLRMSAGAWVSAALAAAGFVFVLVAGRRHYGSDEGWEWVLVLVCLGCWALLACASASVPSRRTAFVLYCASPLVLMVCAPCVLPRELVGYHIMDTFIERNAGDERPDSIVVADKKTVHAVCWYLKRADVYVMGGAGELTYGLQYPDARHRLLTHDQVTEMVAASAGGPEAILILTKDRFEGWREETRGASAPQPTHTHAEWGLVWARFGGPPGSG